MKNEKYSFFVRWLPSTLLLLFSLFCICHPIYTKKREPLWVAVWVYETCVVSMYWWFCSIRNILSTTAYCIFSNFFLQSLLSHSIEPRAHSLFPIVLCGCVCRLKHPAIFILPVVCMHTALVAQKEIATDGERSAMVLVCVWVSGVLPASTIICPGFVWKLTLRDYLTIEAYRNRLKRWNRARICRFLLLLLCMFFIAGSIEIVRFALNRTANRIPLAIHT